MTATPPQPELNVWQRLMADSGPFWKKVNLVGLFLGVLIAGLKENVPTIPTTWLAVAAGISVAMVAAANLAVKNSAITENPNATLQDYINAIPAMSAQIAEIHQSVTNTVQSVEKNTPINQAIDAANIKPVQDNPPVAIDGAADQGAHLEPVIE